MDEQLVAGISYFGPFGLPLHLTALSIPISANEKKVKILKFDATSQLKTLSEVNYKKRK